MPRVTVVKRAQQRYATKPVLNEDGSQKTVVVTKNGKPRVKKSGAETLRRITERDLDRPLPMPRCDFPDCKHESRDIAVGESYKFITTRPGGRGTRHHYRHVDHPGWQYWEYSSSTRAQIARSQADMHNSIDSWDGTGWDDIVGELEGMAEEVASEREEALENMPESLQDGSQAQEYADATRSWADEFGSLSEPDGGAGDEVDCDACDGHGQVEGKWFVTGPDAQSLDEEGFESEDDANGALDAYLADGHEDEADEWSVEEIAEDCEECGGTGTVESDEPSEDYVEEARDVLREAVDSLEI